MIRRRFAPSWRRFGPDTPRRGPALVLLSIRQDLRELALLLGLQLLDRIVVLVDLELVVGEDLVGLVLLVGAQIEVLPAGRQEALGLVLLGFALTGADSDHQG